MRHFQGHFPCPAGQCRFGIRFVFFFLVRPLGWGKFIRLAKIAHKLNLCFMSVVLAAVLFPVPCFVAWLCSVLFWLSFPQLFLFFLPCWGLV